MAMAYANIITIKKKNSKTNNITFMKQVITRMLMLIVVLSTTLSALSYDFEVDGLYYNVVSLENLTCEVTCSDNNEMKYRGIINIPSEVTYKGRKLDVIGISTSAFSDCDQLKEVALPRSIISIGSNAFKCCYNLEKINLPSTISSLGESAFEDCYNLKLVNIPSALTKLSSRLFEGCLALKELVIPANIKSIGEEVFIYSGIEKCIIENSDESIQLEGALASSNDLVNSGSFSGTEIKYLYLGRNFTKAYPSFNDYFFSPFLNVDSLEEVVIGGLVTELPANTFVKVSSIAYDHTHQLLYYKPLPNLTRITFKESPNELNFITGIWGGRSSHNYDEYIKDLGNVRKFILERDLNWETHIGNLGNLSLFKTIEEAVLIKECTIVNKNMFKECTHLRTIVLGDNITNIKNGSFERTDSLLNIQLMAKNPPGFTGTPEFSNNQYLNAKLYVPMNSLENYKCAEIWKDFWNIEEMDFSGMENINYNFEISIKVKDGSIVIINKKDFSPVRIYSLQGQLIKETRESEISGLPCGLYIVTIDNDSFKVVL